jgi:hypothetical protein
MDGKTRVEVQGGVQQYVTGIPYGALRTGTSIRGHAGQYTDAIQSEIGCKPGKIVSKDARQMHRD